MPQGKIGANECHVFDKLKIFQVNFGSQDAMEWRGGALFAFSASAANCSASAPRCAS